MKLSMWDCVHHYHGLLHRCNRNGKEPALHDHCNGECEHWVNRNGETRETVLEKIVFGKGGN